MGKSRKQIINPHFQSVFIASFSAWQNGKRLPNNGMIEPMLEFFGPTTRNIILVDCTHPGSSDDVIPKIEYYEKGKLVKREEPKYLFPSKKLLEKHNTLETQPTFKLRDIFTVAQVLWLQKNKIDLFIGLESIHTITGIFFKKLGKIKTVIYYVSDYSSTRYQSKLFNAIYLWLDRFCATHADYIWDVSPAMLPARISVGLNPQKVKPVIQVPNALFPFQISYLPINKLKKNSLLFAGTIGPQNGLDLAVEALAIVRKSIPDVTLDIFGAGLVSEEEKVKKLIKKLKLERVVHMHGFISNLNLLSKMSQEYQIGLAPYRAIPGSIRWYADATKMRLYFANGQPVITTHVPPLGIDAEKKGCAIRTNDQPEPYANAIIKLLQDENLYRKYRKAAINFAKENTWENTYANALKKMGLL